MRELDQLKEIFLADVDPETQAENLEQIMHWERSLRENELFAAWQAHPLTQQMLEQARKTYVDAGMQLTMRQRDEAARQQLWAKQDAAMWLVSLIAKRPAEEIDAIRNDIRRALEVATK